MDDRPLWEQMLEQNINPTAKNCQVLPEKKTLVEAKKKDEVRKWGIRCKALLESPPPQEPEQDLDYKEIWQWCQVEITYGGSWGRDTRRKRGGRIIGGKTGDTTIGFEREWCLVAVEVKGRTYRVGR